MIISDLKKCLFTVSLTLLLTAPVFAQALQPAPHLLLVNSGYGAAALGMGGAFTAVANDLSAIYWNPAGVGQLGGAQIFVDYALSSDSDEDFSAEVQPNRFESPQRYDLSGGRFQSFAASYSFDTRSFRFTPMFAWQRTSFAPPKRMLKETAGLVNFITPSIFLQSEGSFSERTTGGEDEWTFGLSALVSGNILVGGTLNFFTGNPEAKTTGIFRDTLTNTTGTIRSDITLDQTRKEDFSGTYFRVGMLFFPQKAFRFGATARFPYTRSSTITLEQRGTTVTDGVPGTLDENATAEAEIRLPMEWSTGVALARSGTIIALSVTYSDWKNTEKIVTQSSDPLLIPETTLPYPVLRPGALQNSILQYRVGTAYAPGRNGMGLVMRAGYIWDGQPYGNGGRKYFRGFSLGAGYLTRSFSADLAFVKESGDTLLTAFSDGDSQLSQRRFVFSVSFLSQ